MVGVVLAGWALCGCSSWVAHEFMSSFNIGCELHLQISKCIWPLVVLVS